MLFAVPAVWEAQARDTWAQKFEARWGKSVRLCLLKKRNFCSSRRRMKATLSCLKWYLHPLPASISPIFISHRTSPCFRRRLSLALEKDSFKIYVFLVICFIHHQYSWLIYRGVELNVEWSHNSTWQNLRRSSSLCGWNLSVTAHKISNRVKILTFSMQKKSEHRNWTKTQTNLSYFIPQ